MRSDKSDHVCEQTIWQCTGPRRQEARGRKERAINGQAKEGAQGKKKWHNRPPIVVPAD
jgi:hypothetical protein